MIRNIKVLGLALTAAFALSAVAASAATAQQGVVTSDGPVTLIGTETGGEGANALRAFGASVECVEENVTYTGHELGETPHGFLPAAGSEATITPHYGDDCTADTILGELPATVEMTSCDYGFTVGEATEGGYGLAAHIECDVPGDAIHVEIYNDDAHTERICTVTITGDQTTEGAHIFDTTGEHLGIEGTFEEIHAKREGTCTIDGQGTTTNEAEFDVDVTVEGENEAGGFTELSLSDEE